MTSPLALGDASEARLVAALAFRDSNIKPCPAAFGSSPGRASRSRVSRSRPQTRRDATLADAREPHPDRHVSHHMRTMLFGVMLVMSACATTARPDTPAVLV